MARLESGLRVVQMGKRSKITVKFKMALSGHALLQEASAGMGLSVTEIILRGLEKELAPWVGKRIAEELDETVKRDGGREVGPLLDGKPASGQ